MNPALPDIRRVDDKFNEHLRPFESILSGQGLFDLDDLTSRNKCNCFLSILYFECQPSMTLEPGTPVF